MYLQARLFRPVLGPGMCGICGGTGWLLQHLDDCLIALGASQRQRRIAPLGLGRDIRARLQQQGHQLGLVGRRRNHQRGDPATVLRIDVGALFDQGLRGNARVPRHGYH